MNQNNYHDLIKSVPGRRVAGAEYLVHYSDGVEATVIAVRISFFEGAAIVIECDSDGESLKITHGVLEKIDLEELGRIEVVESKKIDPASLSACVGTYVKRVTLEVGAGLLKALRMECGSKTAFFSNVGDALNFDEAYFRKTITEEGWGALTDIVYPTP